MKSIRLKKSLVSALFSAVAIPSGWAHALTFEADTVYTLNGTLGGWLENRLDGDTRFDSFVELDITGTVTSGAINGTAIETITVNYTVNGGSFLDISFDANGNVVFGEVVGTVNPGAEGVMNYTNAAIVLTSDGELAAAVYNDRRDPNADLPLGTGTGDLGLPPNNGLSGNFGGTIFQNAGVGLQGSGMSLLGTIHESDYRPFSLLGSFMASFGEHEGLGFGFHGWVINMQNSFLGISTEFDVIFDFHASLSEVPPPTEVPEPASMFLLGSALLGAGYRRRSL